MPAATASKYEVLQKLRAASAAAQYSNPRTRGVMSSPPTITNEGTTIPAALTRSFLHTTNPATSYFMVEGGVAFENGSVNRICHYNTIIGPSGGNGSLNDGKNLNAWRASINTDAPTFAFGVPPVAAGVKYRFLVDDQYVDMAGVGTTATAGLTLEYLQLAFGSRKMRKITVEGDRTCGLKRISVGAQDTVQKIASQKPLAVWPGDSYPQGAAAAIYSDGVAMQVGDMLGVSMQPAGSGSTGWVQTVPPIYTFRPRLPDILLCGQPDLVITQATPNDRSSNLATVQSEASLGFSQIRTLAPNALIVVLGSFYGALGASAVLATENAVKAAYDSWSDPFKAFVPIAGDVEPWYSGSGRKGATTGVGNSDFYTANDAAPYVHLSDPEGLDNAARRVSSAIRDILGSF